MQYNIVTFDFFLLRKGNFTILYFYFLHFFYSKSTQFFVHSSILSLISKFQRKKIEKEKI